MQRFSYEPITYLGFIINREIFETHLGKFPQHDLALRSIANGESISSPVKELEAILSLGKHTLGDIIVYPICYSSMRNPPYPDNIYHNLIEHLIPFAFNAEYIPLSNRVLVDIKSNGFPNPFLGNEHVMIQDIPVFIFKTLLASCIGEFGDYKEFGI